MHSIVRVLGLVVLGVLGSMLAVREASLKAPHDHPLSRLSAFWSGHPRSLDERLKLAAAYAAMERKPLSSDAQTASELLLNRDPLSTTPILLSGGSAQLRGDINSAEKMYLEARRRNPRDPAARLLLADLLLRAGRVESGLNELLSLTRISRVSDNLIPSLASYAGTPGADAKLRRVFARNSGLAAQVLSLLAQKPENAQLVLSLAPKSASERLWEPILVDALVRANRLDNALSLSKQFWPAAEDSGLLRNPTFLLRTDKSPFNWRITTGNAGLTELKSGGGLAIVYYGRDTVDLARQLLVLDEGRYRLSTNVDAADKSSALFWRVRCTQGQQLADIPIWETAEFEIPANCQGQWLELNARPGDVARTSELLLQNVTLRKVAQ